MSNPYDFTSGYLAAQELKEKRKQAEEMKSYRDEAIKLQGETLTAQKAHWDRTAKADENKNTLLEPYYKASSEKLQADAEATRRQGKLVDLRIKAFSDLQSLGNPKPTPKLVDKSVGPSSSLSAPPVSSSNFGFYTPSNLASLDSPDVADMGSEPDFNQDGSYSGSYAPSTGVPVRAADGVFNSAGRAVAVPGLQNSGEPEPVPPEWRSPERAQTNAVVTTGPVTNPRIQVSDSPPVGADLDSNWIESLRERPAEAGKTRSLAAPSPGQGDAVAEVRQTQPDVLAAIEKTVRKATTTELSKMLNQFAALDWAEGKINAGQLQDQLEKAKVFQAEGFARAAAMAITGNTKQAMKMFAEHGNDDGSDVASLTVEKITKDIPGSKAKDIYSGLRIKYSNGEEMLFDPKDFLIQTASLKAALDHRAQGDNSLRDDERAAETNRNNAAATAENRAARLEATQTQNESNARFKFLNILGVEAKQDFDRVADQLKNDPRFIGNEEARNKLLAAKEQDVAQRRRLAEVNYDLGNPRVSYGAVQDALARKQDVLVKNGAPVVFETPDGFRAFKHQNGVFLPESLYKQEPAVQPTPQQTAIPGPAGRQRPPQTPIIPTPVVPGRVQQMQDRFNALEVERQSAERLRGTRGGVAQEWAPGGMKRMQYDSLREALSASQSN